MMVSTRSRPKAAGQNVGIYSDEQIVVSTRSRPKAAGDNIEQVKAEIEVSTRSRPKAAGFCNE